MPKIKAFAITCLLSIGITNFLFCQEKDVLSLSPIGYWPANQQKGEWLLDVSNNQNHGKIYHISWENGLLNFTSGFQWVEIPKHDAYKSDAFSIGCWVFSRRDFYYKKGMLLIGIAQAAKISDNSTFLLNIYDAGVINVTSGGKTDVMHTKAYGEMIPPFQWHHIIYTYDSGESNLYLNGNLIAKQYNVPYKPHKSSIVIGCDSRWWNVRTPTALNGLHGSISHLVMFDRALKPDEVELLKETTKPTTEPIVPKKDAILSFDGTEIQTNELLQLTPDKRRRILETLEKRDDPSLEKIALELLPILSLSVQQRQTRLVATKLLKRLDLLDCYREVCRDTLHNAEKNYLYIIQNQKLSKEERATSVLALTEIGKEEHIPILVKELEELINSEGIYLTKVEDIFRNALINALLKINPRNKKAKDLVGKVLVKPVFDQLEVTDQEIVKLIDQEQYMDALGRLPRKQKTDHVFSYGDRYRDSRGDSNQKAYTPITERGGYTYILGAGEAFNAVEAVSKEEYDKQAKELADMGYEEALNWKDPESTSLFRVPIKKSDQMGNQEMCYLAGPNFIFDGKDTKVKGWSIAVDKNGYIHIIGGQHNQPGPDWYIPGSWEMLGLSRDKSSNHFPNQIYFISKNPGDIHEFEFVGRRDNPRQIPSPNYLNYMNFVQDNNGELYLYGRIDVEGRHSWGLYWYDVDNKRWEPRGGQACDMIAAASKSHPSWIDNLVGSVRGKIPTDEGPPCLVWAWQPNFYNFCRSSWGIRFDTTNRMHIRLQIQGLNEDVHIEYGFIYAYSDDGGKTFYGANGAPLKPPLTLNPAPGYLAYEKVNCIETWWNLWFDLLFKAKVWMLRR